MKFESFKAENGGFQWRLREEGGQVVSVRSGKIMGLDSSPANTKAAARAVTLILQRLADTHREGGKRRAGDVGLKMRKG